MGGENNCGKSPEKTDRRTDHGTGGNPGEIPHGFPLCKTIKFTTDPDLAAAYTAVLRPRQNLYSRALADFMSSPVVKQLDTHNYNGTAGSSIRIRAIDDFRVTAVRVEIYDAGGALHETGNAVQNINGLDWTYTAQLDLSPVVGCRIKASAVDIPGNVGVLEQLIS